MINKHHVFNLKLDETDVPKGQIVAFVRDMILSGAVNPGDRMPSTRALIEQVQKQFRGEDCEPIIIDYTLSSMNSNSGQ